MTSILTYYGALFAVLANDTSPTFALPRIYWTASMPISSGLMLAYALVRLWRLLFRKDTPPEPASSSAMTKLSAE